MRLLVAVTVACVFCSSGFAQDVDLFEPVPDRLEAETPVFDQPAADVAEQPPNNRVKKKNRRRIANPFSGDERMSGMGGMMGAGGGGMEEMMEMEIGMDMGMGGDEMMMDEMGSGGQSSDQDFRRRLSRAITALSKIKSPEDKTTLQSYVRDAFADRYDKMIQRRKKDVEQLKKQISKLELDLVRREQAKDRVVQLQLQSVQLASEGLLDLNDFGSSGGGFSGGGMEEGGGGMGFGN